MLMGEEALILSKRYTNDRSIFGLNTAVITGDSLTQLGYGESATAYSLMSEGYFNWANILLGQRFTLLNNAGVGGYRSDQCLSELETKVLPYKPNYCFVCIGVNDVTQGIAYATTIANIKAIYDTLLAAGIRVITFPVPPCSSHTTTDQITAAVKITEFIMNYSEATPGLYFIDAFKYFVDDTTGNPIADMTYDGVVHWSTKGAYNVGKAVAEALVNIIPEVPQISLSNKASRALNPNPCMQGDTAGIATDYSFPNGQYNTTPTKVSRTDRSGTIQRLTSSAVAAAETMFRPGGYLIGAGNTVYAQVEFETSSITDFKTLRLYLYAADAGMANIFMSNCMMMQHATQAVFASGWKGILKTKPFVTPVNTTRVYGMLAYNLAGVIDIKRFEIIKI
ncbi:SGNH/GDSL hydrolase family protein [Dehalobacter restrictus]|uniref:SGNH hydrolase-type esterase domain-containing protein n=1 Tax=Dehalobacter restrictus TaxID=55583 RepID=A0A857DG02_9FIRM|nr:SGNH/GDSL hydrolase family protein [Dehalobacter restrictus]QGZ99431.1 hypothetical protein GQ588_01495 [Dehalobacter restrictus]